jgi:glycosyltransferase involved in cell wall biosynthesis
VISILHLITDLEVGGAEMMLAKLLQRMDPSRFQNAVVSLTAGGRLAKQIEAGGTPVHSLDMERARIDFRALPKILKLLKQIQPTVLQTWLYHADLLGTLASLGGGRSPLVWNLRCSDMDLAQYPLTTRLTLKLLAFCSRIPRVIIVNSQAGQRIHQAIGYQAKRWELIPNGFDLDEFHPDHEAYVMWRDKLGLPRATTLIGMVARMDPMKDHGTFLEAARRVVDACDNVAFLLAGKGVEALGSCVEKLGLTGKVHLLGFREDVATIMPALDIFTLTSAFGEGFPNAVGEAMACGVPCVVTDVGDAAFVVGATGRVVPPRNSDLLAQGWLELVKMGREKRVEMATASRERIRAQFNIISVVKRYEQCYEELAGGMTTHRHGHCAMAS